MQIITAYGTMWARNTNNINNLPKSREPNGKGIYILFDGSMPLYVGKGNLRQRISKARYSKRRGQLWDRFSWYAVKDPEMMHDIEVFALRMLPTYLRALTRQDGRFVNAARKRQKDESAEVITRKTSKL